MIIKENAIKIAQCYLEEQQAKIRYDLVLLFDATIEFEFGWVFFYQSKEFVETGDIGEMLGGNSPIIVSKQDGSVFVTGTGYPIEKYIADYKAKYS
jgi:Immunity protein 35